MQKLLAIGTVGKKIAVSGSERSRKFEFWLNVNETRTDADGKAYTVTTPVHCTAFRPLSDEEFGKRLTPCCGAIVRGLVEPLLVGCDGKQFAALIILYAGVQVVGRDVQAGMSVSAVGYVGMADTNTVNEMQVCNFSMAENLLDKQTGETRALWMRCALWRRPDKTKVSQSMARPLCACTPTRPAKRACRWNAAWRTWTCWAAEKPAMGRLTIRHPRRSGAFRIRNRSEVSRRLGNNPMAEALRNRSRKNARLRECNRR